VATRAVALTGKNRWRFDGWPGGLSRNAGSILLAALMTGLVVVPMIAVAWTAFAEGDGFSLRWFTNVFRATTVISNTALIGVGTTAVAVVVGGVLALVLVRINTPGRGVLEKLVVLPLHITPLLTAIAWSWLGSPRGGLVNLLARQLGIADSLINLYTPAGVIFVAGLAYVPLSFILISGALRGMDPALEESARVQGASTLRAFRMVTIPLMLPAVLGAGLLVLLHAIGLFSVPQILGAQVGFYVAGTEIYHLLRNYPPRLGQAAAWGICLLVLAAILVWAQNFILNRRSYITITGKAFRPRLIELQGARWFLAGFAWLYVFAAVILPVAVLTWVASIEIMTINFSLIELTTRHFNYVLFSYPKTYVAAWNSLILGLGTATAVCVLGLAIGWVLIRTRSPARSYLDQVSTFPATIPSMVLALGVLWTFVGVWWIPIYGTLWILLVAHVAHFIPFGVRAVTGAMRQLHPELEEAARVAGASWAKMVRFVTFPLLRPTLVGAWTLTFVLSLQEISASILLYTSSTIVMSVAVFDLWEQGNISGLAALSVVQLVVVFTALALTLRSRQREIV
jgi:iron(III) transport system permease protein